MMQGQRYITHSVIVEYSIFLGSPQKVLGDGVNETQARDVKLEMYLLHMHFRLGSAFKIRIGPTYVELFGD